MGRGSGELPQDEPLVLGEGLGSGWVELERRIGPCLKQEGEGAEEYCVDSLLDGLAESQFPHDVASRLGHERGAADVRDIDIVLLGQLQEVLDGWRQVADVRLIGLREDHPKQVGLNLWLPVGDLRVTEAGDRLAAYDHVFAVQRLSLPSVWAQHHYL